MDGGLYAARQKIYPREIDGRFQRLRTIAAWVLLGIFYVIPWIPWGGRQAVLFDLPARKFHIFALTLWPQDFYFLTWLLVIAALALFFFTALAGRLFCGYACPQTVWTETFLWMERLVEGNRSQQMKLARAPWGTEKILRKGGQAAAVDHLRAVDRLHVRRLLHADHGTRGPDRELRRPARGRRSGCCSTAAPPTSTRASCASRSASTCVRTRASRARCSTRTR